MEKQSRIKLELILGRTKVFEIEGGFDALWVMEDTEVKWDTETIRTAQTPSSKEFEKLEIAGTCTTLSAAYSCLDSQQ